jgi:hypothetical protein
MALEREIAEFERRRDELEKAYPLKFVVFHEDKFVGAWDTLDAAAGEAIRQFGAGPYLIRQIGAPKATLPASVLYRPMAAA